MSRGRCRKISAAKLLVYSHSTRILPHRLVAARRRVDEAARRQHDRADLREPAPDVRVLAMKLDGGVEAADRLERIPVNGEVPAVEHRPHAQHALGQEVRRRGEGVVVEANQQAAGEIPVVKAIAAGHRRGPGPPSELGFDPLQPSVRRLAVGVQKGEQLATRVSPSRLARDDESLTRLVDHFHPGRRGRDGPCAVGARVVDDDDFVGRS